MINPLILHKNHGTVSDIAVLGNGEVINEQSQVCYMLNWCYANSAGTSKGTRSSLLDATSDQWKLLL